MKELKSLDKKQSSGYEGSSNSKVNSNRVIQTGDKLLECFLTVPESYQYTSSIVFPVLPFSSSNMSSFAICSRSSDSAGTLQV